MGFFVCRMVDLSMKNTIHSTIGWCAGLAIGMTIGVSQSNIILGIGLGLYLVQAWDK